MDEQMKEGLALGGSSKAQLWGSEVERGGSTLAKHNTSGGESPAGSCVCRSGAGVTQIVAYLGRKAKVNSGSSGGHIHDHLLGLAA